jgi:hypothetical protein
LFGLANSVIKQKSTLYSADEKPPLRSDLFSAHQVEQYGQSLASSHKLSLEHARDQLLTRLTENERMLSEACTLLISIAKANRQIASGAEWLLDNFY